AAFFLTTTATTVASNVVVAGTVLSRQIDVGYGKTVNFKLSDGANFTIAALSVFGATSTRYPGQAANITGTGASHTTFSVESDESATIQAASFSLGQGTGTAITGTNGNTLT